MAYHIKTFYKKYKYINKEPKNTDFCMYMVCTSRYIKVSIAINRKV